MGTGELLEKPNKLQGSDLQWTEIGSRVGAVVRVLASHQCVPGSIPGSRVMWVEFVVGSLLCSKRFSPGTLVFPSSQKPTFPNSNSILECTGISERVLLAPWCSEVNKLHLHFHFFLLGSCSGRVEILLAASYYRNQDMLRQL